MGSLEERTRLSTALNDIDMRIHSNRSFDEILQCALDGFVEALRADAGDIKIRDGDEWVVRYEHGFGDEEVGLRLHDADAPVASLVARTNEPVTISDYESQPSEMQTGFPARHELRATLAVPLVVRDEVIGALFAWMNREPREFTRGEVDFGRRMAASVALALENARLFGAEQWARQRAEAAEQRLETELQRTRVLLKASDELTSTIDTDELVRHLGQIIKEATGIGRVFVNLIDMDAQILIPKVPESGLAAPTGTEIPFERLSETAREAIFGKRRALLDYERPDLADEDRAIALANHSRLVLFIPLVHQGQMLGHIALDEPNERYPFNAEQVRIVESIAAQASVALRNARSFEREHRIADELQQAILSPPEPIDGLEVAYLYQPASAAADVGGDFYDVMDLGNDRVVLMIGDIAGKGIEAARLTTLIRDGARAYLHDDANPCSVVTRLNSLAYRFMPVEKYATVFLGVLDCATGTLDHSGAGHPPPVVMGAESHAVLQSVPGMLGAFPRVSFPCHRTTLDQGDILVLVTDGVTEARAGKGMFGQTGVIEALEKLRGTPVCDLPSALLAEVLEFADGHLRDDVVIMCVAPRLGAGTPN